VRASLPAASHAAGAAVIPIEPALAWDWAIHSNRVWKSDLLDVQSVADIQ
jgi:hypothetical protein